MSFTLGGVRIDSISVSSLHATILGAVHVHQRKIIFNVNANAIVLAQKDMGFRDALNHANLVFCDGFGVLLASKILGGDISERITYADWIYPLSALCEANGLSMFLLGGKPGVAFSAAAALQQRYKNLSIAGTHHGYFDRSGLENKRVINKINKCSPDVLLVAFGMPEQEIWISRNLDDLPSCIILPCGACFDYVSGRIKRGPKWMTNHGLEWLARLLIEPRRLWRRYIIGNILFMQIVIRQKFIH